MCFGVIIYLVFSWVLVYNTVQAKVVDKELLNLILAISMVLFTIQGR